MSNLENKIKDAQYYFDNSKLLAEKCNHPNGIKGVLMTILINTPSAMACIGLISLLFQRKLETVSDQWDKGGAISNIVKELDRITYIFLNPPEEEEE